MADENKAMFEGTIKTMHGFLDCYDGSKLKGMVCAPGVYEKGTIKATKDYSVHPAHVEVANAKVRPFTQTRLCQDYEVMCSELNSGRNEVNK